MHSHTITTLSNFEDRTRKSSTGCEDAMLLDPCLRIRVFREVKQRDETGEYSGASIERDPRCSKIPKRIIYGAPRQTLGKGAVAGV